jgi:hypothetical protein
MWSTLGRVSARAPKLLSRAAAAAGDAVPATVRGRRFPTPDVTGDAPWDGAERPIGAGDRRRHDVVSGDQRLDPSASNRDTALPLREPVRRVEDARAVSGPRPRALGGGPAGGPLRPVGAGRAPVA